MKPLRSVCLLTIVISTIVLAHASPVPLVNQPLVPASTKPGSGAFKLIVNGTGFSSSSTVNWNGATRVTEFVSSTTLKALINASDVAKAGTASVTVTNPPPGGGTSNVVFFPVRKPVSSVGLSPVSGFPAAVVNVVGDFNNDGLLDVAVGAAFAIDVYLGKRNGTFSGPIVTNSVTPVTSMLAADFNGDGHLDLAVLDGVGNTTVFLGDGNGKFVQRQVFFSPSRALVAGDFNGDGKLDLVVVGYFLADIFLGKGDGTFGPPQRILVQGQTFLGNPAIGDFNGDGNLDLAIPDGRGGGAVHVLLGKGDGTFQNDVPYNIPYVGLSSAAADINADGKLDIVTNGVSVLLGNGDGTFTSDSGVQFSNNSSTANVNIADFNGDGKLDVAIVDNNANEIALLLGNGDGTFQNPIDQLSANGATSLSMGDFNGDGALDLVGGSLFLQVPVSLSPGNLSFGDQQVGTKSPPQSVTLKNVGASVLKVNQISIGGTNANDFSQTNNCPASLPVGASSTIKVVFAPRAQSQDSASLDVSYQGVGSPQSVALTGTGTAAPTVSLKPSSLTFSTQTIGTTSPPQTATLTNTGSVAVTISNIAASGAFSETNNCPSSLPVGANCQIKVEFTPTAKGPASGKLSVTDDAKGSPQTVALSGTGTVVELSVSSINFGDQKVGTKSAAVPVQLTNTGTTTLSISQITITGADPGDFAETNNCGTSVPAGGSCTIKITFKPTVKGQRSASLSISDDGGGSPQEVALAGTGT